MVRKNFEGKGKCEGKRSRGGGIRHFIHPCLYENIAIASRRFSEMRG